MYSSVLCFLRKKETSQHDSITKEPSRSSILTQNHEHRNRRIKMNGEHTLLSGDVAAETGDSGQGRE